MMISRNACLFISLFTYDGRRYSDAISCCMDIFVGITDFFL